MTGIFLIPDFETAIRISSIAMNRIWFIARSELHEILLWKWDPMGSIIVGGVM